ncbi:hypothetical protein SAY87_029721 [Trapa incisa]|uniref:Uncharacterized protein n=1 Tax=Trapa incisa TaxID=236973 RepID=A0AAN7Q9D0_9MYRT|nr:hypothetical protein SAY87_029721 [Trapa incisa]
MDPYHVESPFVFDISSDGECCGLLEGKHSFEDNEDSDWLAKFVRETNAGSLGGDSDEVVLVKEVNPKSKSKGSQQLMDDDDCVILDSDPDRSVAASDAPADDNSSDDLLIVGESGQKTKIILSIDFTFHILRAPCPLLGNEDGTNKHAISARRGLESHCDEPGLLVEIILILGTFVINFLSALSHMKSTVA